MRNRRSNNPINAGSMADIAFLLLIFFLVTTTMDSDAGILSELPPPVEFPDEDREELPDQLIFDVKINADNQLLVEGDVTELIALKDMAVEFLDNPEALSNHPKRQLVTVDSCQKQIDQYEYWIATNTGTLSDNRKKLEEARRRMATVKIIGPYRGFHPRALMLLETQRATEYDTYIAVQNELQAALNELRNALSLQHFGRRFDELDAMAPQDQAKILAIRTVYPQRLAEPESTENLTEEHLPL